jgi:hypothetical protein
MEMNDKEKFIAELYPAARKVAHETGMSWELILAQAAQETGWGQRQLAGTNNIFNIKAHGGWDGPTKTFNVWEIEGGKKVWRDEPFRVYESYEEALRDRVKFLQENPRYTRAGLFDEGTKGDLGKEAAALQKAGYATDPGYADSLVTVFNGPTMRRAIAHAQSLEGQAASVVRAPSAALSESTAGDVLKLNANGDTVARVQEMLSRAGYHDDQGNALVVDGHFGLRTQQAVLAFQQANGLTADGIVGPRTFDALAKAGQTTSLSDASHPNNAMYQQAVKGLEQLGPEAFSARRELENAAGTLVFDARVSGLTRVDRVVASSQGTGLFAVQGGLDDPTHQRAYVDKAQAISQPLEQSTRQLQQEGLNQAPQQEQEREQRRMMTI